MGRDLTQRQRTADCRQDPGSGVGAEGLFGRDWRNHMMPLLQVRGINKWYGTRVGCADVSFDLYPGELMRIVMSSPLSPFHGKIGGITYDRAQMDDGI